MSSVQRRRSHTLEAHLCVCVFQSVIMLSGMGGGHSRDEDEEDELFTEEDSL